MIASLLNNTALWLVALLCGTCCRADCGQSSTAASASCASVPSAGRMLFQKLPPTDRRKLNSAIDELEESAQVLMRTVIPSPGVEDEVNETAKALLETVLPQSSLENESDAVAGANYTDELKAFATPEEFLDPAVPQDGSEAEFSFTSEDNDTEDSNLTATADDLDEDQKSLAEVSPMEPFEGGVSVVKILKMIHSECDCKVRINGHTGHQAVTCLLDGKPVKSCGGFEQGKPLNTKFIEKDDYEPISRNLGHCKCTFMHNSLNGNRWRLCKLNGRRVANCKKYGIRRRADLIADSKVKCTCVVRVNTLTNTVTRACKMDGRRVPSCKGFVRIRSKGEKVEMHECQCMVFQDEKGKPHKDCLLDGKREESCAKLLLDKDK